MPDLDLLIVDTDILIDAGRGVEEAVQCLQDIDLKYCTALSVVTQMELIVGCRNKNELRNLDRLLGRFRIIGMSESISDRAVDLLRRYRLSHGLLIPDAMIASAAMALGCGFVSKNQRDYRFIEDLYLLPYPNPFG